MPQIPPAPAVLGQIFERPRKLLPNRQGSTAPATFTDPVLQGPTAQVGAPSVGPYFEGTGNVNSVLPPDTNGDIGPNHYVQMVNLSFAIWDKNGNKLYGPVNNNTLWGGFGGPCQSTNDGDPIVLYDHLADRWMFSQLALPNYPRGPFYQCLAISQSGDPLGPWHRYEFTISQDKLNDYPKFGVWPDGYYMAINQFKCTVLSCSWAGQGVVAFEREKMLLGQPARMVLFDLYLTNANLGGMLPSDLDGPVPPIGAPNPFAEVDDNSWGYSPDQLQIWQFHVDWNNTANSTFNFAASLPTAAFDANLCNYYRNCIPQPGTGPKVDAISDRLMYRLQYRNFGTHQTLVTNHTVDVNGADRAGIRWYELRNTGGGWSIYQQGTYAPDDGTHRWMGSTAMNGQGNIALGYSRSSASLYPSIVATGRLAGDAAGQMTQPELTIKSGSGSQTHSSGRWGDYSHMSVDPADNCTFWYTQEYYDATSIANWKTFIGSFRLTSCGPGNIAPTASFTYSCSGLTCNFNGSGSTDSDGGIVNYDWDFGDGTAHGSGVTTTHSYASAGTRTVTLTVTDNEGATDPESKSVTVAAAADMHVGDLDGSASTQGGNKWKAAVTITIHNTSEGPVSNATVSGTWSGAATANASCSTNTSGQCSVSKPNLSNNATSITFKVNNVTHATLTYNSATNHDPDGDSTINSSGISITLTKP